VRLAGALVPDIADNYNAMCINAADARMGLRGVQAAFGQALGSRHHYVIECGEFHVLAHHSRAGGLCLQDSKHERRGRPKGERQGRRESIQRLCCPA
jgi:hypothetical protein